MVTEPRHRLDKVDYITFQIHCIRKYIVRVHTKKIDQECIT